VALSRREREILQLVAAGKSSTAIAEELNLGVSTIRTYALNARKKLGAKTLAEAVAKGISCGEIRA
jgi:DNA-binding CsgD family transcriptional regulator